MSASQTSGRQKADIGFSRRVEPHMVRFSGLGKRAFLDLTEGEGSYFPVVTKLRSCCRIASLPDPTEVSHPGSSP